MGARGSGGLLQSPVLCRGVVDCTPPTAMSNEATTVGTTASQLVASGIKNFKL